DVAAGAAVAGEAAARVEQGLAAREHVATGAVLELAPHERIVEGLARLEQLAVLVPAALDLDAGFPAPLADDPLGERAPGGVAAAHLHPREAQLGVLLPEPVGGESRDYPARRRAARCASRRAALRAANRPLRHRYPRLHRANVLDGYPSVQLKEVSERGGGVAQQRQLVHCGAAKAVFLEHPAPQAQHA